MVEAVSTSDIAKLARAEKENLWIARFGSEWVSETDIKGDFYAFLLKSMLADGILESHWPAFSETFKYKLSRAPYADH